MNSKKVGQNSRMRVMDRAILTHFFTERPINILVVLTHILRSPLLIGIPFRPAFSINPVMIPLARLAL